MTQSSLPLILIAAVVGGAAGAAITTFTTSSTPPPALAAPVAAGADPARLEELANSQARLETALKELRAATDDLAARAQREVVGAPAVAQAVISAPAAVDPAAEALQREANVAALMAELAAAGGSDEAAAIWQRAAKEGLTDALVARFEQLAAADPTDPAKRVDLGNAYLQKVFAAGGGPMAGVWAVKADKAFDAALELDPQHWEARFTKAVSLSFWPAALGKQAMAIQEFETLLGQQSTGAPRPEHAQTYLFLGNVHQSSGSIQKALDTWRRGLELFPDNEELRARIASAERL